MGKESSCGDSFRKDDAQGAALGWDSLQRLPTYQRARIALLHGVTGDLKEIDLQKLDVQETKELLNRVVRNPEDNEEYLLKLKNRIDRASLCLPTIEVRFQNLNISGEAYLGERASPSLFNYFLNIAESVAKWLHLCSNRKQKFSILCDASGIIKPGRMTLLLGPPGSGKTTLLKALSGKLDSQLQFSGRVTYNGHEMKEFVPQRTAAYVSQYDIHLPLMTVRETLMFSARCQGIGTSYDMLIELLRKEKEMNIKPDPYIDALMKASVLKGQKEDIVTEYILKILGLDVCADTIIGNEMIRGISGGQKKRVTTGEMLVCPVNALFMDNISTGLDSSTTFQIVNSIRQSIHIFNKTAVISLLQPPPETFELFDDIILLSEGRIVYQGPREHVLEFFESMGFRCPERKGVADYLQEVTSRKDQGQYWSGHDDQYRYISADEFVEGFKSFRIGRAIQHELAIPFQKSNSHPAALIRTKYGATRKELMKACLSREFTLMKRSASLHIFKSIQLELSALVVATVFAQARKRHDSIDDGVVFLGALYFGLNSITFTGFYELPMTIEKLPVFYKQRDLHFYPSWAFSLPASIFGIPTSFIEVAFWVAITYFIIGFDPSFTRVIKQFLVYTLSGQMSYALFRCLGAVTRDTVVANTGGCLGVLWLLIFGGFILSHDNMQKWLSWGYWTSPLMYAQTALSTNEFLSKSWARVPEGSTESLGILVLKSRGLFVNPYWYWISVAALFGFIVFFNVASALFLASLNEYGKSQTAYPHQKSEKKKSLEMVRVEKGHVTEETNTSLIRSKTDNSPKNCRVDRQNSQRMLLPFTPLYLTFENIKYSVDVPKEMKAQGASGGRLDILKGVSGAFRPGVLTALMGISGAGKTTLLDVLAGRKNSGYIEGSIRISGFPKKQETFAQISGYCEQNDIHSPYLTVYESLIFSAWLRLPSEVDSKTLELFVEEIIELIELTPLRDSLVGFPHVNGLSIEQRKRLTIAVELVANPSIIFLDEPTSGLDARAAAIVMRAVRNTVDTGRTVVCTIHQPSIDIFESFDELFLLTRGGEEIYVGPLGQRSCHLIKYFEDIPGVDSIRDGYNPATWVLDMTTAAKEEALGIKFADVYKKSDLFRQNEALIRELSAPPPDAQALHFPSTYPRSYLTQFKACLWKQHKSFFRNTSYNAVRMLFSASMGLLFGAVFLKLGSKRSTKQEIFNSVGAMYIAINFMGTQGSLTVQPVLITERTVYYRERAAGMYSALPHAFAQVAIEFPYTLVQVALYAVIVYAMMGYEWTASKFLLNYFFMFITILYFIYYGMVVVAVSPNQATASMLTGFSYSVWNLFTGFVIPRTRISVWWRWYAWICPVSWSLYGTVTSQFADIQTKLDTGETVAEFIEQYYGYKYDFLWVVSVALLVFTFLMVLVFVYATKHFNFQKR
ncbi:ABC transporter G family member 38-like [Cucurbita pepo subsp. pepo]|uniref:ABC transporter G family member 38-like n=1 Tax=Cucurbita pepo subsp. pepo TaxID=3664 RepID=UPI000C9D2F05|nr:ABC transporter G family member 38-like [Cucurbita pepo subsp. pepo]